MGTRNLVAVVLQGVFKIAQYGQWDGYPSGQGTTVLEFMKKLLAEGKEQRFREAVDRCFFYDDDETKKLNTQFAKDMKALDKATENIYGDAREKIQREHWLSGGNLAYMSRDVGAEILGIVLNRPEARFGLVDQSAFAKDSLFCEWAYVVDLDERKIEVYEGFKQDKPTETDRFNPPDVQPDNGYYPVRLKGVLDFDNLPETMEQFEDSDEEEEAQAAA